MATLQRSERSLTTPNTEDRIAAIDAQAQTADGVQQQAQVNNLYQSTIAGNTAHTSALLTEERAQRQAKVDTSSANLMALAQPAMHRLGVFGQLADPRQIHREAVIILNVAREVA